jgi:ubiquinone/menaquinone biosynthesis C-methylase UbiE
MNFTRKLMQAYFDYAYNQVYDFTTARLNRYRKLQERCVGKLEFKDNDRVLCVGLGTGNELFHILETNRNVDIVGVDYSRTALQKAYKKVSELSNEIELLLMEAQSLQFPAGSFDKVLCIHVMDFVEENEKVTDEILRVLKNGGQFVITYPSDKEGVGLGLKLLKDSIRHNINSGKNRVRAFSESLAQMLVGIVYLPLFLRRKKKTYSRQELETIITGLTSREFQIEQDSVYQDFVVYGRK